jgi:hypothetical protein
LEIRIAFFTWNGKAIDIDEKYRSRGNVATALLTAKNTGTGDENCFGS